MAIPAVTFDPKAQSQLVTLPQCVQELFDDLLKLQHETVISDVTHLAGPHIARHMVESETLYERCGVGYEVVAHLIGHVWAVAPTVQHQHERRSDALRGLRQAAAAAIELRSVVAPLVPAQTSKAHFLADQPVSVWAYNDEGIQDRYPHWSKAQVIEGNFLPQVIGAVEELPVTFPKGLAHSALVQARRAFEILEMLATTQVQSLQAFARSNAQSAKDNRLDPASASWVLDAVVLEYETAAALQSLAPAVSRGLEAKLAGAMLRSRGIDPSRLRARARNEAMRFGAAIRGTLMSNGDAADFEPSLLKLTDTWVGKVGLADHGPQAVLPTPDDLSL